MVHNNIVIMFKLLNTTLFDVNNVLLITDIT